LGFESWDLGFGFQALIVAPFDSAALTYDTDFTHTPLVRALRARVWERLGQLFPAGSRVLELGCGTGEDAQHLASHGVRVFATDQSEAMLAVARRKCAGLPVEFAPLDFSISDFGFRISDRGMFDGVFSNFGGLNMLPDYQSLISNLQSLIKPGGPALLVLMGRWCAWEILWHLAHLDRRAAFRRLHPEGAVAWVGGTAVRVRYPATASLRRAFAPHFHLTRVRPLGVLLPPSYLEPLTRRRVFPFRLFAWLDRRLPLPLWGDHVLYEFRRNPN